MKATLIQQASILDAAHLPASYLDALALYRELRVHRIIVEPDAQVDILGTVPYHPKNIVLSEDKHFPVRDWADLQATTLSSEEENNVRTGVHMGRALYSAAIPYLAPLRITSISGLIDQDTVEPIGDPSMRINRLWNLLKENSTMSPEFTAHLPTDNPYGASKLRIGICACGAEENSEEGHFNISIEARYLAAPMQGLFALERYYPEAIVIEEILAGRLPKTLAHQIYKTQAAARTLEDFKNVLTTDEFTAAYEDYKHLERLTLTAHVRAIEKQLAGSEVRFEHLSYYDKDTNLPYLFPVRTSADIEPLLFDDDLEQYGMPTIKANVDGIALTIDLQSNFYTDFFGTHRAAMQITANHPLDSVLERLVRTSAPS